MPNRLKSGSGFPSSHSGRSTNPDVANAPYSRAMVGVRLTVNEHPVPAAFQELWQRSWGGQAPTDRWESVLGRSLCFVCAYAGNELVGFVNVAWDGGVHASLFDTTVHPAHRRRGIGAALVRRAAEEARLRGAEWLHVDFEPHLVGFYRACGFRHTEAGLLDLTTLPRNEGTR